MNDAEWTCKDQPLPDSDAVRHFRHIYIMEYGRIFLEYDLGGDYRYAGQAVDGSVICPEWYMWQRIKMVTGRNGWKERLPS